MWVYFTLYHYPQIKTLLENNASQRHEAREKLRKEMDDLQNLLSSMSSEENLAILKEISFIEIEIKVSRLHVHSKNSRRVLTAN